jgi:DNA segregation ATPase FtsK/SpoIIIE-like protein
MAMNFIAQNIPAAMTRQGTSSRPAGQSPQTAVRPGVSQPRAQNFGSQPGETGNPGAIVDPHSRDGGLSRSGGGIKGTVEEHVARGRQNPKVAKLTAFYAAGAGFRDGRPAEHCPYDQPGEDELRDTWFWFYRIQAEAAKRARPATAAGRVPQGAAQSPPQQARRDHEPGLRRAAGRRAGGGRVVSVDNDEYRRAVEAVVSEQRGSTSFVQRRLQIAYSRAAHLIERMELEGILSKPNIVGKRLVLWPRGEA